MPVNKLTKHYNIIKQFIKCCAGEGDEAQARQAVAAVTPAAERGNVKAQYLLGRYYSQGYHTNRDHQQAVYWYEKAAGKGSEKAAAALLDLYRCDWPDGMDAEQKKALGLTWRRQWIAILADKAAKGVAGSAKTLMKLYIHDCPDDITPEQGVTIARKWYERWIEILKAKADSGDMVIQKKLADILYRGTGVPRQILERMEDDEDGTDEGTAAKRYAEVNKFSV